MNKPEVRSLKPISKPARSFITGLLMVSVLTVGASLFLMSGQCFPVAALCHSDQQVSANSQDLAPGYLTYSPQALTEAAEHGRVVLYFWAPWCSSCNTFDLDVQDRKQNIPEGVTVLRVPYDTAHDLKQKYNVVIQHTFVQVDKNGQLLTSWAGGGSEGFSQNLK